MRLFRKERKKESEYGQHENPVQGAGGNLVVKYQCPMKCEGDKVYDQPGICPVCKMKLVQVK